jgi:predicted SAM-dependent methyltransferase
MLRRALREHLRDLRSSLLGLGYYILSQARHGCELRRYCDGQKGLLLNIGCGRLTRDGWVNIDVQPSPGKSFYLDVRNGLPLSNCSARHIHCEHFLEHLEFSEAKQFLCECARVLENGGSMRLIVPDLEKYVIAYTQNDHTFFRSFRFLGGAAEPLETKGAVCNQMFRMGGSHKFAWDFETLREVARHCGFSEVSRSAWGDVPPLLNIDGNDEWRSVESLYVKLVKS